MHALSPPTLASWGEGFASSMRRWRTSRCRSRTSLIQRKRFFGSTGSLKTPDHELLRDALSLPAEGGQALHGDAAVTNCIAGGDWIDFDLAARGPREGDVATLVMRDWVHRQEGEAAEALAAYGPCDRDLIHVCLRAFVALTCVLLLEQATSQPPLASLLAERLAWLRSTR